MARLGATDGLLHEHPASPVCSIILGFTSERDARCDAAPVFVGSRSQLKAASGVPYLQPLVFPQFSECRPSLSGRKDNARVLAVHLTARESSVKVIKP